MTRSIRGEPLRPPTLRALMLGLVLTACGGGPPPETPAGTAAGGDPDAPAPAAVEAQPSDSAEAAPPSAAPAEKPKEDGPAGADNEFKDVSTRTAKQTRGVAESKLAPTKTEALLKLLVIDKETGPVPGIVVSITGADGKKLFAPETDKVGYSEVLVPAGQRYEFVYLSLGRKDIAATTLVENEPRLTMKLTLTYKGYTPAPKEPPRFVLDGVNFDTAKATIRPESFDRLDRVVEYMTHKKSSRIEISGHTDNVGKPQENKALSEKRAEACRDYVVKKGIEASRIRAVGFGDERPIAPNDAPAGRQKNRRIEATEL